MLKKCFSSPKIGLLSVFLLGFILSTTALGIGSIYEYKKSVKSYIENFKYVNNKKYQSQNPYYAYVTFWHPTYCIISNQNGAGCSLYDKKKKVLVSGFGVINPNPDHCRSENLNISFLKPKNRSFNGFKFSKSIKERLDRLSNFTLSDWCDDMWKKYGSNTAFTKNAYFKNILNFYEIFFESSELIKNESESEVVYDTYENIVNKLEDKNAILLCKKISNINILSHVIYVLNRKMMPIDISKKTLVDFDFSSYGVVCSKNDKVLTPYPSKNIDLKNIQGLKGSKQSNKAENKDNDYENDLAKNVKSVAIDLDRFVEFFYNYDFGTKKNVRNEIPKDKDFLKNIQNYAQYKNSLISNTDILKIVNSYYIEKGFDIYFILSSKYKDRPNINNFISTVCNTTKKHHVVFLDDKVSFIVSKKIDIYFFEKDSDVVNYYKKYFNNKKYNLKLARIFRTSNYEYIPQDFHPGLFGEYIVE